MADMVFISYARTDTDFALKLVDDLKAHDVPVWLDQLDIPPGVKWHKEIQKALRDCTHLLIVLSPDSVASDEVDNELQYAISQGKQIVPILYRACERPFRIHSLQYVDFSSEEYGGALDQLLLLFSRVADTQPGPKPLPRQLSAPILHLEEDPGTQFTALPRVNCSWTSVPGANDYVLEFSPDASFSNAAIVYEGELTTHTWLKSNYRYCRVKARGRTQDMDSPWSDVVKMP